MKLVCWYFSPGGASAGDAGVGAGRDLLARIRQLEGENAELAAQLAAGKEKVRTGVL